MAFAGDLRYPSMRVRALAFEKKKDWEAYYEWAFWLSFYSRTKSWLEGLLA